MFENAILVLLYGKSISESNTLSSIKKLTVQFPDAKLVVWNNGPARFNNYDITELIKLGYQVEIIESLNNQSLAKIYNQFIRENSARRYVLLDDDSVLNDDYVSAAISTGSDNIAMPIITFNGKVQSPSIDHKRYSKPLELKEHNRVLTIGSGLVIGNKIVEKIRANYGNVFDKRFYLYDVDTTFCIRLYKAKLSPYIIIIPGFEHSLSRLTKESKQMTEFRRLERSYALGLRFRYYTPLMKAIFLSLKTSLSALSKLCVGKRYKVTSLHLWRAFLLGKHYRAKM